MFGYKIISIFDLENKDNLILEKDKKITKLQNTIKEIENLKNENLIEMTKIINKEKEYQKTILDLKNEIINKDKEISTLINEN